MTCPFCLSNRQIPPGMCPVCLHQLKPDWLNTPPHLLSPKTRLELVVWDSQYILRWMSRIYAVLADTHPGTDWHDKYSIVIRDLGSIPFLLDVWMAELHHIPNEPEEAACQFLELRSNPPETGFILELRRSNEWRYRASNLSRTRASREQVAMFQAEIVKNTWWGLYGSVEARQKVIEGITANTAQPRPYGSFITSAFRN